MDSFGFDYSKFPQLKIERTILRQEIKPAYFGFGVKGRIGPCASPDLVMAGLKRDLNDYLSEKKAEDDKFDYAVFLKSKAFFAELYEALFRSYRPPVCLLAHDGYCLWEFHEDGQTYWMIIGPDIEEKLDVSTPVAAREKFKRLVKELTQEPPVHSRLLGSP